MFLERRGEPNYMDRERWEALAKPFKGGRLLDAGCLDSMIPFMVKSKYPESEVWGLDQAEDVMEALAQEYPEIHYTHGDVYETGFEDDYFDYVVAGELIEHLERPADFFKEAFRILKPGGILALTTPRDEEPGGTDGDRHLWAFTKEDIRDLARPYMRGAQIKEIPNWIQRRIRYHTPYLIAFITKK